MESVEIQLANGDVVKVEGSLGEIERALSDAARSGHSRMAWFTEDGSGERIGVNPVHVAALRVRTS